MGIHLTWLIRQPKVESRVIAASKIHSKIIYNPSARLGFFIHFLTQFLFPFLALSAKLESTQDSPSKPSHEPSSLCDCHAVRRVECGRRAVGRGAFGERTKKKVELFWAPRIESSWASPLSVSRADSYVENARLKMNVGEKYKLNYRTLMNFLPTVLAHTLTLSYNSSSSLWKVSLSASTRSVPVMVKMKSDESS